jgi:hypothetical protein
LHLAYGIEFSCDHLLLRLEPDAVSWPSPEPNWTAY